LVKPYNPFSEEDFFKAVTSKLIYHVKSVFSPLWTGCMDYWFFSVEDLCPSSGTKVCHCNWS